MSKERKKPIPASSLEKVLTKLEKESDSKSELSHNIDLIVAWLKEIGLDFESNGNGSEIPEVFLDEQFEDLLDEVPHDSVHGEQANLLIQNGNGEEDAEDQETHKYKFYQFKRKHNKVKYNAIGTDDLETIEANEGRILALEHETKGRKIALIAYAEDAPDETPFPDPEKSVSLLVEFSKKNHKNTQLFLPRTSLSQLDPNNFAVIQGVISNFMTSFIADVPTQNS